MITYPVQMSGYSQPHTDYLGRDMDTRSIAVIALIIAVIVLLIIVL